MQDASDPPFDARATVRRLFIYPVKSCAGVELRDALLTETGLDLDRAWMVVDREGRFVTQRELPRMALVQPSLRGGDVVLRAPGMLALHLRPDLVEEPVMVTVWNDHLQAYDMGDLAAQWFSDFLAPALPGQARQAPPYRLVRFDPEQQRLSNKKWTGADDAPNQFSDGFPVLVISQASLDAFNARLQAAGHAPVGIERFRPNLVIDGVMPHDEDRLDVLHIALGDGRQARLRMVKPCPRCPIPNIDPATALSSPVVGDTLQGYRQLAVLGGAVAFGMNAIVVGGAGETLRIGQDAQANFRFA